MAKDAKENEEKSVTTDKRLFSLLILGICLVFVGIAVLVVVSMLSNSSVSGGAVIFIGPFPIVFGSGPNSSWLILIGIILAVLSVVYFLIMNRRMRKIC